MAYIAKSVLVAGAASDTLATAVSNLNTAVGTAVTAALAASNYIDRSVKVIPGNTFSKDDGTGITCTATVQYYTSA